MSLHLRRRSWERNWSAAHTVLHVPQSERERLSREAHKATRSDPHFWLMGIALPLLTLLSMMAFFFILPRLVSPLIWLICLFPIVLTWLAILATHIVWEQIAFRRAVRQILLDSGIRPAFCFGCGYNLKGCEGNECPACDALLLRQADSPSESS